METLQIIKNLKREAKNNYNRGLKTIAYYDANLFVFYNPFEKAFYYFLETCNGYKVIPFTAIDAFKYINKFAQ